MTAVLFKFTYPDGTPVANATFLITTRKPSFDEALHNGIQMPGDVSAVTDAQGEATVTLLAGFATYYLLMPRTGDVAVVEECTYDFRYRFLVPESNVPLRVEDLIFTTPTFSRPWDETALQIIVDAKAASQASAAAADASADRAEAQTGIIDGIAEETRIAAAQALVSRNEAAGFSDSAEVHRNAAANSATTSEASSVTSAGHAAGSLTSKNQSEAAKVAAETARDVAIANAGFTGSDRDTVAADKAIVATDKGIVLAYKNTVAADKDIVAADKATVNADKGIVAADKATTIAARDVAITARNEAVAAAGTVAGVVVDGGSIDLSGGVYPAKPMNSTVWRVTVAGTVTGTDGDTYGVGDSLFFTKAQNKFWKLDNTESVYSVAGFTGAITKVQLGIDQLNNTSDANKPVSTAQQAALNAKQNTLGYVPVQSGTGAGQVPADVKIGYDGASSVRLTIGVYDFGAISFKNDLANSASINADVAASGNTLVRRSSIGDIDAVTFNGVRALVRNVELGAVGTATTPYIDFNSSGSAVKDYDARIISTAPTAATGGGVLTYMAYGGHVFEGPVTSSGQISAAGGVYDSGSRVWTAATFTPNNKLAGAIDGLVGYTNRFNVAYGAPYQNYLPAGQVYNGAIELRECGKVVNGGPSPGHIFNAPGITFHWSGYAVSKLMMDNIGRLCWGDPNGVYSAFSTTGDLFGSAWGGSGLAAHLAATYIKPSNLMDNVAGWSTGGTVGTYCLMKNLTGAAQYIGTLLGGASIAYSDSDNSNHGAPPGTWRSMGGVAAGAAGIFLRVS